MICILVFIINIQVAIINIIHSCLHPHFHGSNTKKFHLPSHHHHPHHYHVPPAALNNTIIVMIFLCIIIVSNSSG